MVMGGVGVRAVSAMGGVGDWEMMVCWPAYVTLNLFQGLNSLAVESKTLEPKVCRARASSG
jgi:hypothetical protein